MWDKAQKFEKDWWGDCSNTYGEEEKQLTYARKMGLQFFHNGKSPYNIDLKKKRVLDIGGGPTSILLKCVNRAPRCVVIDPILKATPQWVKLRYVESNIIPLGIQGENRFIKEVGLFDEVWIYNVLQHTDDPALICKNARKLGKIVRVFEWIDTHTNDGHPHTLTEKKLNKWFGGEGQTEALNQNTLRGGCYFGVFKGKNYEKV